MTRYFVLHDGSGNVVGVGTTDGASYPAMDETDKAGYDDAVAEMNA